MQHRIRVFKNPMHRQMHRAEKTIPDHTPMQQGYSDYITESSLCNQKVKENVAMQRIAILLGKGEFKQICNIAMQIL